MWILLLSLACKGEGEGDTGPACGDHNPRLTYDNFGAGILSKHCTGCHSSLIPVEDRKGAPVGVDLESLDGARQFADRIIGLHQGQVVFDDQPQHLTEAVVQRLYRLLASADTPATSGTEPGMAVPSALHEFVTA